MQCEICHRPTGTLQRFNGTVYACANCYMRETRKHEHKRGLLEDLQKGFSCIMEFQLSEHDAAQFRKLFHDDES